MPSRDVNPSPRDVRQHFPSRLQIGWATSLVVHLAGLGCLAAMPTHQTADTVTLHGVRSVMSVAMTDSPAATLSELSDTDMSDTLDEVEVEPVRLAESSAEPVDLPEVRLEVNVRPAEAPMGTPTNNERDAPPDDVGDQDNVVPDQPQPESEQPATGDESADHPTKPDESADDKAEVKDNPPPPAHNESPQPTPKPAPKPTPPAAPAERAEPTVVGVEDVTAAQPLDNPLPDYPSQAVQNRWAGRVVLKLEVSAAGLVTDVTVQRSSGFPPLDESALAAVRRWRFRPARRGAEPVASSILLPIHFRLE